MPVANGSYFKNTVNEASVVCMKGCFPALYLLLNSLKGLVFEMRGL